MIPATDCQAREALVTVTRGEGMGVERSARGGNGPQRVQNSRLWPHNGLRTRNEECNANGGTKGRRTERISEVSSFAVSVLFLVPALGVILRCAPRRVQRIRRRHDHGELAARLHRPHRAQSQPASPRDGQLRRRGTPLQSSRADAPLSAARARRLWLSGPAALLR